MDAVRSRLRELAQAVAQGRLALAEVAAISGDELDAIYETAVMRLDTGRAAEGAKMLAALVVLYPFAHEYWRAYAVALTRLGERRAAVRAKDMARALAPNQSAALAAELLGETGHLETTNPNIDGRAEPTAPAIAALGEITRTDIPSAATDAANQWRSHGKRASGTRVAGAAEVTDVHIDAPVAFADETTGTGPQRAEPTQPIAGPRRGAEPTHPGIEPITEPRITWPVADEPTSTPDATPRPLVFERSMTAIVDRRPRPIEAGSDTARIDRRLRRRVQSSPLQYDDSLTAIVRRRTGAPLGEDV
jgi:hypothetical protein